MISRFSTTARSGMANAVSDTVRAVKSTATTYKESVSTAAKEGVAAAKEVPKGNEPGMRYQNGFLAGAFLRAGRCPMPVGIWECIVRSGGQSEGGTQRLAPVPALSPTQGACVMDRTRKSRASAHGSADTAAQAACRSPSARRSAHCAACRTPQTYVSCYDTAALPAGPVILSMRALCAAWLPLPNRLPACIIPQTVQQQCTARASA